MSKGVLVFARNNAQVDYVKQAYYLAKRVKQYLNLPTSVVTDSTQYLKETYSDWDQVFDKVISIVWKEEDLTDDTTLSKTEAHTIKRYYDGSLIEKPLEFKNETRTLAYDLTPYSETLMLDSDIVIADKMYLQCFDQEYDFLIYRNAQDLAGYRDYSEFSVVSDNSVEFYWATCVFFRKSKDNCIFFNLLQHIQENWQHYNSVFQLNRSVYRNDHAFSIAIHIMNGYQTGSFAHDMPGTLFYTLDRDILWNIDGESFMFLVEKEDHLGEYTPIRFSGNTVHVMNKFSLNRHIDKEFGL